MSPPTQAASIVAWRDEAHVRENRRLYREKFDYVAPILSAHLDVRLPAAGFYLWASVARYAELSDTDFARELHRRYNVAVLPGSYLARSAGGVNPGENYVRIALVAGLNDCLEAARRIADFCQQL
jgi:N-succinyldiaminopimelate aminotransferase